MNEDSVLEPHWAKVEALQNRLRNRTKIDHKAFALDEQIDEFLEALGNGELPDEPDQENWLTNLETNRQRKYRHRSQLLSNHAAEFEISISTRTQLDLAIENERVRLIETLTTRREFSILYRLASGEEYRAIAVTEAVTVAALKTMICRCRQRLRNHLSA